MRQNNENRGGLVEYPKTTYRSKLDHILTEEGKALHKRLFDLQSYEIKYQTRIPPVISLVGLVIGLRTETAEDLEKLRVYNNWSTLKLYIATWDIPQNITVLNTFLRQLGNYPNIEVHVKSWSYEKDLARFISKVFSKFDVVSLCSDINSNMIKRFVMPFLMHHSSKWIEESETSNKYVIKIRSAGSLRTDINFEDVLRRHLAKQPYHLDLEDKISGSFGYSHLFAQYGSSNGVAEECFVALTQDMSRVMGKDEDELVTTLVDFYVRSCNKYYKRLPNTEEEVSEFFNQTNYLNTFEGMHWFCHLLRKAKVPYSVEPSEIVDIMRCNYNIRLPWMRIVDGKIDYDEEELSTIVETYKGKNLIKLKAIQLV